MLNAKQENCEYQLLKSFVLTRPWNRTLVYRLRGERSLLSHKEEEEEEEEEVEEAEVEEKEEKEKEEEKKNKKKENEKWIKRRRKKEEIKKLEMVN